MHASKIYLIIYYYKYTIIYLIIYYYKYIIGKNMMVCNVSDNIPHCTDIKHIKKNKKIYLPDLPKI